MTVFLWVLEFWSLTRTHVALYFYYNDPFHCYEIWNMIIDILWWLPCTWYSFDLGKWTQNELEIVNVYVQGSMFSLHYCLHHCFALFCVISQEKSIGPKACLFTALSRFATHRFIRMEMFLQYYCLLSTQRHLWRKLNIAINNL